MKRKIYYTREEYLKLLIEKKIIDQLHFYDFMYTDKSKKKYGLWLLGKSVKHDFKVLLTTVNYGNYLIYQSAAKIGEKKSEFTNLCKTFGIETKYTFYVNFDKQLNNMNEKAAKDYKAGIWTSYPKELFDMYDETKEKSFQDNPDSIDDLDFEDEEKETVEQEKPKNIVDFKKRDQKKMPFNGVSIESRNSDLSVATELTKSRDTVKQSRNGANDMREVADEILYGKKKKAVKKSGAPLFDYIDEEYENIGTNEINELLDKSVDDLQNKPSQKRTKVIDDNFPDLD